MAEPPKTREGYHLEWPNREKASSKVTKLVVFLLLVASAGLVLIVTLGGWAKLAGGKPIEVAYIAIYLVLAFLVLRWNRGVLPMSAALAIILGIFAGIAGPEWLNRASPGYSSPALPPNALGLITLLIIPVQLLLIIFAMRGFAQSWNVEVEVPDGEHYRPGEHGQAAT